MTVSFTMGSPIRRLFGGESCQLVPTLSVPKLFVMAMPLLLAGQMAWPVQLAAQEVVQALPNPAAAKLGEAMQRLSRNPESVPALVDAGRASLDLDDIDGALGFFNRAQRLEPGNGRMLSGLALVALRRGDAVTALQLFDNANLAGEAMRPFAADRGLAYDLVGSNARAQRLYRQALGRSPSPEVTRRLAISYAIGGNAAESEEVLLPLLQRQDRAAFRARAFALAILGKADEAVAIAETMLPERIANRMAPYLRYMPRLTHAQQAAAANLGRFPSASQIGREDPRMAAIGVSAPEPQRTASAGERLIPGGEPLGQRPVEARVDAPVEIAAVQSTARSEELPAQVGELPALVDEPPVTVAVLEEEREHEQAVTEPVAEAALPSNGLVEPEPEPEPGPAPEPLDLAAAFAEFGLAENLPVVPAANAVDITAIAIPREQPKPAQPPPPVHPSRHWVQLATGQDVAAFRFDWRRLGRKAEGLLDDRDPFRVSWGQTNRLVTGPFDSAREAQQFVTALGAAGVDSFRFTSEEGREITPLQ